MANLRKKIRDRSLKQQRGPRDGMIGEGEKRKNSKELRALCQVVTPHDECNHYVL